MKCNKCCHHAYNGHFSSVIHCNCTHLQEENHTDNNNNNNNHDHKSIYNHCNKCYINKQPLINNIYQQHSFIQNKKKCCS